MDESIRQEAEALIECAQARKGLITILVHQLECCDDPFARMAAAELRVDRDWQAFTCWYDQRGGQKNRKEKAVCSLAITWK